MRLTGKIDIRATALEPIVHGAGTSGNTQLLRMQEIVYDGVPCRVPFVSGNSVTPGDGSKRKPGGIIERPYLDGERWLQFPEVKRCR